VSARVNVRQDYAAFLRAKTQVGTRDGFRPVFMPERAFDFQEALIDWSVWQGRAADFADCGMGKTVIQLAWAENVVRHTNRPVLVLTPLAVAGQTVREAEKFGIEAHRSRDGVVRPGVNVTNYEQLHHFSPADFAGVVCDESSILKSFDGVRRQQITDFMRKMRHRLLCTATAAPNDYHELGTSSEALGYLGYMDMLGRFFKNDQNNASTGRGYLGSSNKFRLKGHAEEGFWRWVCSWARALRKPSDLGFDNRAFILPELIQREHVVAAATPPEGMLFSLPAVGLQEQREEQRRTIQERCERVASLVAHDEPALVWCQLNAEGDLLERLIPGAVQVSGADSDEAKEERFLAFANGEARVLVTKPTIGAWGLNFQHCAHVTFFPSHSFEQFYQGVRRCWRFGQTRPVTVDLITTEGGRGVLDNLQRKAEQADEMFDRLVALMNDALHIERTQTYPHAPEVPSWL
jgi:hypothetical protein